MTNEQRLELLKKGLYWQPLTHDQRALLCALLGGRPHFGLSSEPFQFTYNAGEGKTRYALVSTEGKVIYGDDKAVDNLLQDRARSVKEGLEKYYSELRCLEK